MYGAAGPAPGGWGSLLWWAILSTEQLSRRRRDRRMDKYQVCEWQGGFPEQPWLQVEGRARRLASAKIGRHDGGQKECCLRVPIFAAKDCHEGGGN
jgi:hypothetical protein